MEITIVQAILIGVWSGFCLAGMLLGIYTNRCLVMATGVGLILGDPVTGLAMGAIGELALMGFGVSQGGSVPPNHFGPGVVGAILAITTGMPVEQALSISIPFAILVQFIITATYTFATTLTGVSLKALDNKNFKLFRLAANATVWTFAVVGFILGVGSALSAEALSALANMIPAWLSATLTVAGGMLPAIGFAMILNVMMKKEYIPFVMLGYVLFAYLNLSTMAVTIVATCVALIIFFNSGTAAPAEQEVEFEDGI